MNHFSDLLAIRSSLPISITVSSIADNGVPDCEVVVNGRILHQGKLYHVARSVIDVDLAEPIDITIAMSGKQYSSEKETAVLIKSINIDGFEIVPNYTHHAEYINEKNQSGPTSYLGYNGVWKLAIQEPFYRWRHRATGQGWLLDPL